MPTPRTKKTDAEPIYDGHCRANLDASTDAPLPNTAYRFRVPDDEAITFTTKTSARNASQPDKTSATSSSGRKDGIPSYQLAT